MINENSSYSLTSDPDYINEDESDAENFISKTYNLRSKLITSQAIQENDCGQNKDINLNQRTDQIEKNNDQQTKKSELNIYNQFKK